MTKAVFGQVELDIEEYRAFLLSDEYLNPTKPNGIYRVSELGPFFEKAQKELEQLLRQVPPGKPLVISPREELFHEYYLFGHGMTGTNREGKITGWSGDMLCHSWNEIGRHVEGGIEQAKEQRSQNHFTPAMCFVSDLPRAIHHALILGDRSHKDSEKSLFSRLEKMAAETSEKFKLTGFDNESYKTLMMLALENGFIPTPLLRAQYYGPLELEPEKLKETDKKKWIDVVVSKAAQQGVDPGKARREAEIFADALVHRKELLNSLADDEGNVLIENRPNLVKRVSQFYDTVNKIGTRQSVTVVTSSGCLDASRAYFRYFGDREKLLIENEPKQRGRTIIAKLGSFNGAPCYLNDPKAMSPFFDSASNEIRRLQSLSIDALVREGKGIVEPKLLKVDEPELPSELKEEFGIPEPKVDDLLTGGKPVIVFGHGGQGKTILLADLAKRLITFNDGRCHNVPVIQNCEQINKGAKQFISAGKTLYDYLISTSGIASIPEELIIESGFVFLLDDYQKLNPDFSGEMEKAVQKLTEEGHYKAILFSRLERPGILPPSIPGFDVYQIESPIDGTRLDDFLSTRLSANENAEFRNYVERFDSSVTGHYLSLSFLAMLFGNERNSVLNYIQNEKISQSIKERRPLNSAQLYEALTDYLVGLDVERLNNGGLSADEARKETARLKSLLGEKAECEEELPLLARYVPSEWSYMDMRFNELLVLNSRLQKELRGVSLIQATKIDLDGANAAGWDSDAKVRYFHLDDYGNNQYHIFIHDTFREFFAARHVFEQLRLNNPRALSNHLSKKVLDFLVEMRPDKDLLYKCIYSTRRMDGKECGLLGGNSLTLLSALGEDLRGKDFSGANLAGAKLTDKNLEGMIIENAYVNGADFTCSNLNKVNVKGAVKLEKCLPDSVDFAVVGVCLDDVYLLSREGSIVRWNVKSGETLRLKVASEMMALLSQKYNLEDLPYLMENRISFNSGHTKVAVHHAGKLSVYDLIKGVKIFDKKTKGVYRVNFLPAGMAPSEFGHSEYLAMFSDTKAYDIIDLKTFKDPLNYIKKKREIIKKKLELARKKNSGMEHLIYELEMPKHHEFSWLEHWASAMAEKSNPLKEENPSLKSSDGTLSVSYNRIYTYDRQYNGRKKSLGFFDGMVSELKGYDEFMPLHFTPDKKLLYVGRNSSNKYQTHIVLHDIGGKKDQVLKSFDDGKFFILKPSELVFVHQSKSRIGLWQFDQKTSELKEFYHFDKDTFARVIRG